MRTIALGDTEATPIATVTDPPPRSRLGAVAALVGAGLLMQGVADALARNGDTPTAMRLFVAGMAVMFGACAWRLTGASARRNERLLVSLVLGLGLLTSYLMRFPLLLTSFDELLQRATLSHLLSSHAAFPTNTLLPISPYYSGLELVTAATRWLTGLPLAADQVIVLIVVRVLLVLTVFLVVERVCESARAGGIGALVYMSNPQFYGFDSSYAYETMALALGAAVVYLLIDTIDRARPHEGWPFTLALCAIAGAVVTHHLTGWLTAGFLAVWAIGLALSARYRTPATSALRSRWGEQARIIGIAAAAAVGLGAGWLLFVGSRLIQYVGPIFSAADAGFVSELGNLHGNRQLFHSGSGAVTPTWDKALILGSAVTWCLLLVPSLYVVVIKRRLRGGPLRYLPAVIAASYPILLLANISSNSKEVAGRATAFSFFGVAVVVGAWVARRIADRPRRPERMATVAIATLVGVGSLLFGVGPIGSLLPGPYQVGADNLSLGSPSLAVAHWADMNIPAGTHVAADRVNGVLLNAIAGVDPVTPQAGLVNGESLYFDHTLRPYDVSLIRRGDIHYVFVDDRLARGLPLYGVYVADGEPHTRLTLEQLNKFDSTPRVRRVYDNGPIKVYDVSALLTPSERALPTGPPDRGVASGVPLGILLLAVLVVALWVVRLIRHRTSHRRLAHRVVCTLTVALVLAIAGAFAVRVSRVPPDAAAVVVLLVLGGLSLWRAPGESGPTDAPKPAPRSRVQLLIALAGGALLLGGVAAATVASLKEWTPPPELALTGGAGGQRVAQVQLGSAGPVQAHLSATRHGRTVWISPLARTAAAQHVALPPVATAHGARVTLVVQGKVLRTVGN